MTRQRDRGATFVEILVAIVLMGTVVLAILSATRTSISASATSREAANVESRLIAIADDIERAAQTCGDFVPGVEAHIVRVEHLDFGVDDVDDGWHDGACHGGTVVPNLVQRYTITSSSSDGSITRTLQVVKGVPIEPAPLDGDVVVGGG